MCCCISDEPIDDPTGKIKTYSGPNVFQKSMMMSPWQKCPSFIWCAGQFFPLTCGVTQCLLRRKVLEYDMTRYMCCQGYIDCCCFQAGSCAEEKCPSFCLFIESCFCNSFAISASRMYVMDKYQLSSDPCDYRLIRINNCLQILSCICNLLAMIDENLRQLSNILDCFANIFYHAVSGCMTSQVANEMDYQISIVKRPGFENEGSYTNPAIAQQI